MYTMAAGDSDIPAIRGLADDLYMLASASLNESIAEQDRLLDAINAGKILAGWLFDRSRDLEGQMMINKAIS
jgi:hypothetical protein